MSATLDLTFRECRRAGDELQLVFDAILCGLPREVTALAGYHTSLGAQFPHPLHESGRSLGNDRLDAQVQNRASEVLALLGALDTWRSFEADLRRPRAA